MVTKPLTQLHKFILFVQKNQSKNSDIGIVVNFMGNHSYKVNTKIQTDTLYCYPKFLKVKCTISTYLII